MAGVEAAILVCEAILDMKATHSTVTKREGAPTLRTSPRQHTSYHGGCSCRGISAIGSVTATWFLCVIIFKASILLII